MSKTQCENASTYAHQEELPSLPVPSLEETLGKFVASVKPFLSDEVVWGCGRGWGTALAR